MLHGEVLTLISQPLKCPEKDGARCKSVRFMFFRPQLTNPGEGGTEPGFQKRNTLIQFIMKAIKTILAIVCLVALVLAGAENPDGSCNLVWTLSCLAVVAASGYGLKKMEESR